jgi:hypothetical protein
MASRPETQRETIRGRPTIAAEMRRTLQATAIGLAAGFAGGLFGIGGGLVMVPVLVLWFAMGQHRAHGTSAAVIVAAASAGLIPFAMDGEVDWTTAGWILCGSLIGAFAGATLVSRVSSLWLARAFFTVTVVAAIRMAV